jgi:hypothetical protein
VFCDERDPIGDVDANEWERVLGFGQKQSIEPVIHGKTLEK